MRRAARLPVPPRIAAAVTAGLILVSLPGPARSESNLDRIREKCEEFLVSLNKATLDHFARGQEPRFDRVHKDFAYLFNDTKVSEIGSARAKASSDEERRALELLKIFVEAQILDAQLAAVRDEVLVYELGQTVEVPGGGEKPFRTLLLDVVAGKDRTARKAAYIAATETHSIANVYRGQMIASMIDKAKALGYPDLPAMIAAHKGLDIASLREVSTRILAETEEAFTAALEARGRDILELEFDELRRYDLEYLSHPVDLDKALDGRKPVEIFSRLARGLGLPFDSKLVELRIKNDDGAVPQTGLVPVQIERSLVVAARPSGAASDFVFAFEGLGRCEAYQALSTPQFEFRRLERRMGELTAGYLAASLLARPAFATSALSLSPADAERLQQAIQFRHLAGLRHDASSLLFQFLLYEDFKIGQMKYNEHMEQHLKVKHFEIDSERYLEDHTFEAAERLVGRLLAAHLGALLRQRFGDSWWQSAEAGAFLRGLLGPGSSKPVTAVAAELGLTLTDSSPLVQEVTAGAAGS